MANEEDSDEFAVAEFLGTHISAALDTHSWQSQSAQSIPDLSGIREHAIRFEPLASGPTSLINRSRRLNGTGDGPLTGDYTNPILPEAAEVVKRHGGAEHGDPVPHNHCWLEGPPFVFIESPKRNRANAGQGCHPLSDNLRSVARMNQLIRHG
jgi:hypothetical protein